MHKFKIRQKNWTVIIVGKCVTNAGKWIWGGDLPVGKSFAKKILEHCVNFDLHF